MYDIFHSYGFNDKLNESVEEPSPWNLVAIKSVEDSDGFLTDYSWYTDGTKHIFMFGDSDFVIPDPDYADWECDSKAEAQEWFDNYNGFAEDEDLAEFDFIGESNESFIDRTFNSAYGIEADDIDGLEECDDRLTESYNNLPDWFTKFLDSSRGGNALKTILSNQGIDLANATYIQDKLPSSNRDPVLKDTSRLSIFRLQSRNNNDPIVYIHGVNNPMVYIDGKYTHAQDLPMKVLLDLTLEYGYIDLKDEHNLNQDIHKERAELKQKAGPIRGRGQYPVERNIYGTDEDGSLDYNNIIGTDIKWVTTPGQDKSGYQLDPKKYVHMLDNVGLDTYGSRLSTFYNRIEECRAHIAELVNKLTVDTEYNSQSLLNNNAFSDLADAINLLGKTIDYYKILKDKCANIVNRTTADKEDIETWLQRAFKDKADTIRDNLKAANKILSDIESQLK